MAAIRNPVKRRNLIDELNYWRGIRLDFPTRKTEALKRINMILDEWNERNGPDG